MTIKRLTHIFILVLALAAIPEAYLQFRGLLATAQRRAKVELGNLFLTIYAGEAKSGVTPRTAQSPTVSGIKQFAYPSPIKRKALYVATSRRLERNIRQSRYYRGQAVANHERKSDTYLPSSTANIHQLRHLAEKEKPRMLTIATQDITFLRQEKPASMVPLLQFNLFPGIDNSAVESYRTVNLLEEDDEGNPFISIHLSDVSSKENNFVEVESWRDNAGEDERNSDHSPSCSSK